MNAEQLRLDASNQRTAHWKRWGPYVSERAWGTVREDYSAARDGVGVLPARPRAVARVPLERGRARRHLRPPSDHLLRDRALERPGPHPEGAGLRPDRQRRQPRRGRQGVLLLSGQHADPLVHEIPVQVSAAGVSVRGARRREPQTRPQRAGIRAARHRRLRQRPLLRRLRRVREGLSGRHAVPDLRRQPRRSSPRRSTVLPTVWFRNTWSWGRDNGHTPPRLRRGAPHRGRRRRSSSRTAISDRGRWRPRAVPRCCSWRTRRTGRGSSARRRAAATQRTASTTSSSTAGSMR